MNPPTLTGVSLSRSLKPNIFSLARDTNGKIMSAFFFRWSTRFRRRSSETRVLPAEVGAE